jgi:hypothetical protein
VVAPHRRVERAQELHRVEVLLAAVAVGLPLARGAAVVEVEHRRDAVDAQPVGVEAVEPEVRARQQEAAHLVAAVVELRARPLRVDAAARVGVLEEVAAVELEEPVRVGGEVRRHPVEDHPEAATVQRVDQEAQVVGRAVARRRREEAGHLVAP